VYSSI
jgi:hypothetical protein